MTFTSRLIFVSILMIFATPVLSETASHLYKCEQDEDASDAQVLAAASEWLHASKKSKGGENLELRIHFPVAATVGETDFLMVVSAPSLAEWGKFMDHYEGASMADADKKFDDIADCTDSALWESIKID